MAQKNRVTIDESREFIQYIPFTGTQSAANTFLEIAINTTVVPADEFILEIQEVQWEIATTLLTTTAFTSAIQASLSRLSKAAPSTLLDADLLARDKVQQSGGGTFGAGHCGVVDGPRNMVYSGKAIIAQPTVYFQYNSFGYSAAHAVVGRIYYKQVPMSKDKILEILYG